MFATELTHRNTQKLNHRAEDPKVILPLTQESRSQTNLNNDSCRISKLTTCTTSLKLTEQKNVG